MPEQKDYGVNDSDAETTLVPGSLIAYRHFALTPTGNIAPMNNSSAMIYGGAGPHEAACRPSRATIHYRRAMGRSGPPLDHETPHVDCTCGFYAHYKQGTDFYGDYIWNKDNVDVDDYYVTYQSWTSRPGFDPQQVGPQGVGMVRAVVELTGRIVMGHRGVRAQKLKVLALAVDWDKYKGPDTAELDTGIRWGSFFDTNDDPWSNIEIVVKTRNNADAETRWWYETYAAEAAARVGASYFTDVGEMYDRFPEPDLEALGISPKEPRPAPPPITVTMSSQRVGRDIAQQTALYAQITQADTNKILADIFDVPPSSVTDTPPTPLERVMLEKKNRPAPPGTGIDRRKRKL